MRVIGRCLDLDNFEGNIVCEEKKPLHLQCPSDLYGLLFKFVPPV